MLLSSLWKNKTLLHEDPPIGTRPAYWRAQNNHRPHSHVVYVHFMPHYVITSCLLAVVLHCLALHRLLHVVLNLVVCGLCGCFASFRKSLGTFCASLWLFCISLWLLCVSFWEILQVPTRSYMTFGLLGRSIHAKMQRWLTEQLAEGPTHYTTAPPPGDASAQHIHMYQRMWVQDILFTSKLLCSFSELNIKLNIFNYH